MKILVFGSRNWIAQKPIYGVLSQLPPGTIVVHGDCRGADRIAGFVAEILGFEERKYPALANGRKWPWAGAARNQEMLDKEHPDADGLYLDKAFCFHEDPGLGKGSADMDRRLKAADPKIAIEYLIGLYR